MKKQGITFIQRFAWCVQLTATAATTGHLDAAQRHVALDDLVAVRLILLVYQPNQAPLLLADAFRFVAYVVVRLLVRRFQFDGRVILDDLQLLSDDQGQLILHQTAGVMVLDYERTAQLFGCIGDD